MTYYLDLGPETKVNTYAVSDQKNATVAALTGGGYVVIWTSEGQDGATGGIYAQLFDGDGNKTGGEFRINATTAGDQDFATAVGDAGGGFEVFWQGPGTGIDLFHRDFDANGTATTAELTTALTGDQSLASLIVLASGTRVVAWTDSGADGSGNGVDELLSTGVPQLVNSTTSGDQSHQSMAALKGGGYVITWQTNNGTDYDVAAQRFSATGTKVGGQTLVNTTTDGVQYLPEVAGLADGGYVITWNAENKGFAFQRYAANGTAVGSETAINTASAIGIQYGVSVAGLSDGGFVVAYQVQKSVFGTSFPQIALQVYDANGDEVGPETQVSTFDGQVQANPSVTALSDGGFVVSWQSSAENEPGVGVDERVYHATSLNNGTQYVYGTGDTDTIDGGPGADYLYGGAGDDVYTVNAVGEVVGENANQGNDTVDAYVSYTLSANVENLMLQGASALNGSGNGLDNVIVGNFGANILTGYAGDDLLVGGLGNDSLNGNAGNDYLEGDAGNDTLAGGADDDYLDGGSGNDTLDGGGGVNQLYGGDGNDVITMGDDGNQAYGGTGDDSLTGGLGSDYLDGGSGNDTISGGGGADSLYGGDGNDMITAGDGGVYADGGAGNDTFVDGAGADTVYGGDGDDTIQGGTGSGYDHIYGGAGNDTITVGDGGAYVDAGSGDDSITGGAGNDSFRGGDGDDMINGGGGADIMIGGTGNDTYVVDNAGDVVTESQDGGNDTVFSSVNLTLSSYVENLILVGAGGLTGNGNALDNHITGDVGVDNLKGLGGNDVLDGGAGADKMLGGGDDTYYVDNTGDKVFETTTGGIDDGGNDTVIASISYLLGSFVENLVLTGTVGLTGTGNALNNSLTGSDGADSLKGLAGNDVLDGGLGADKMLGGAGDDTYVVDNSGDKVYEATVAGIDDGGHDTVISGINFSLGDFLEDLVLQGSALNGTGNGLNNAITGNDLANGLSGGTGDDVVTGGAGNDKLTGGAGADTFMFAAAGTANGIDHLVDFVSGTDKLGFTGLDYGIAADYVTTAADLSLTGTAVGYNAQFVYNPTTHTLYWDSNGAHSGGATAIAYFDNGAAPAIGDFVFV